MEKFKCVGVIVSEPTGDLVKYSDVHNLCEELVDFVAQLIDEIQINDLSKEKSIGAFKTMLKLSLN
jgi:hypothetical protein